MVKLFEKSVFRGVELKNRIVVSPMGMYSAHNGYATPFHLVHYGKFAQGGAGLVFVEQTSVVRKGRISNGDLGIWEDGHIDGLRQITQAIRLHGSKSAIQLGHGGRKAGQQRPPVADPVGGQADRRARGRGQDAEGGEHQPRHGEPDAELLAQDRERRRHLAQLERADDAHQPEEPDQAPARADGRGREAHAAGHCVQPGRHPL